MTFGRGRGLTVIKVWTNCAPLSDVLSVSECLLPLDRRRLQLSSTCIWLALNCSATEYFITDNKQGIDLLKSIKQLSPDELFSRQVIILIGNKADLEAQRDVTYEEAKQFAEENGKEIIIYIFFLKKKVDLPGSVFTLHRF